MSGPGEIWVQAAEVFDRSLSGVSEDQWSAATPCEDWDVRALVDHAVETQARLAPVFGASPAGSDWESVRDAIAPAITDPSNLEGTIEGGPFAGMPKHQMAGIAVGDLLLHAWDVAKATDGNTQLPAEAVEAVQMGLSRMPAEMMRASGRFGAAVEIDESASPQDQLIAFSGRQP